MRTSDDELLSEWRGLNINAANGKNLTIKDVKRWRLLYQWVMKANSIKPLKLKGFQSPTKFR
jgi:hypothetical protein